MLPIFGSLATNYGAVADQEDTDAGTDWGNASPAVLTAPNVNDVLGSLASVAGQYLTYKSNNVVATSNAALESQRIAADVAKTQAVAKAAPLGVGWSGLNWLPGNFGWNPQADGLPPNGTASGYSGGTNYAWVFVLAIVGVVLVIFAKR